MWLLNFLPSWIFYAIMAIGAAGLLVSYFLSIIPVINQYKLPLQILSIIVLIFGTWFSGGLVNELIWQDRVKEMEDKVAAAVEKSKEANTVIQTKVVNKIQLVQEQVEVVRKEIEIQKEVINAECKISDTAIQLYNKSVTNPAEIVIQGKK